MALKCKVKELTQTKERVWTEDKDGEVRKSKLIRRKDGTILVKGLADWHHAKADGTFYLCYMERWWPR
jgi:hypothetical protein